MVVVVSIPYSSSQVITPVDFAFLYIAYISTTILLSNFEVVPRKNLLPNENTKNLSAPRKTLIDTRRKKLAHTKASSHGVAV